MEFVDCTKRCTEKQMLKLKSYINKNGAFEVIADDDFIMNTEDNSMFKAKDFISVFENKTFEQYIQSESLITFIVDNTAFMLLGKQYLKWCDSFYVQRLKEVKQVEQTKIKEHFIEIIRVRLDDCEIITEQTFTGNNTECIEFINKTYQRFKIASFMKDEVLIKIDESEFYTLEELFSKGILLQ